MNYNNMLKEIVLDPKNIDYIKNTRLKLRESNVYIYGSGNAGCLIYEELISNGYNVTAFLDRNGSDDKLILDKHVYSIDSKMITNKNKQNSMVIVALLCSMEEYQEIKSNLESKGFYDVRFYFTLHNSLDLIIHEQIDKMSEALNLLSDDKSKEIFIKWVDYIVCGDKVEFEATPDQYFPKLPTEPRYSRFIDCGAFIGDTYLDLKGHIGKLDAYACFEADITNFTKSVDTILLNNISETHILLPMAVWNKSEILSFNNLGSGSGTISNIGGIYIQAVAIDQCLPDFAPTFIKMDIEGAEMNALMGAKNTIVKYKPDMAVCIYHRFSHLWECIRYINELSDGYKFYIKCHFNTGQETVLYAINEHKSI